MNSHSNNTYRHHLNGNAVYNVSHAFVQHVAQSELLEMSTQVNTVPRSSFDVRFCEVAILEMGVDPDSLGDVGYKATQLVANFASTLVLRDAFPPEAMLVHGARIVHDWSARSSRADGGGSITLVMSDWGETGELDDFVTSINAVAEGVPFTTMSVVTQVGVR